MSLDESAKSTLAVKSIYAHFGNRLAGLGLAVDYENLRQDLSAKPEFIRMRLGPLHRTYAGAADPGGTSRAWRVRAELLFTCLVRRPAGPGLPASGGVHRPRELRDLVVGLLSQSRSIPLADPATGESLGIVHVGRIVKDRPGENDPDHLLHDLSLELGWLERY